MTIGSYEQVIGGKRWRYPPCDDQFHEYELTKVEGGCRKGWTLSFDGRCFFCPPDSPIVPKKGMTVRLYGKGFAYTVRGLFVEGVCVFHKSEKGSRRADRKRSHREKIAKRRKFEESGRAKLDAQYDALPDVFQRRLDRFRAGLFHFRTEFEPYELFACEQAVVIAAALDPCGPDGPGVEAARGTPDFQMMIQEIFETFGKLSMAEQEKRIEGLNDGHSGNTYEFAKRLAFLYLAHPELVVLEHGAMTPLVGCKEYGCTHDGIRVPESIAV